LSRDPVFLKCPWKGENGGMATACTVSALAYSAIWNNQPTPKQRFTRPKNRVIPACEPGSSLLETTSQLQNKHPIQKQPAPIP